MHEQLEHKEKDSPAAPMEVADLEPNPNELPRGDKLEAIYQLEFGTITPKLPIRMARGGEVPDIDIFDDDVDEAGNLRADPSDLSQIYIKRAAREASSASWWNELDKYAAQPNQPLSVTARHDAIVEFNGKPLEQGFQIFELGESVQDKQTLGTVFDTLTIIDQFSGGLLAADPNRPRIALMNDARMENNLGDEETMGFAGPEAVVLNMRAIASEATKYGMNPKELLAVVMVHEILGHSLERTVEGGTGKYLKNFFKYSDEKIVGNRFNSLHASIDPTEELGAGSEPAREYGRVNAAEDFATSVDSAVADAMRWTDSTNKSERVKSTVDAYRRDLVMKLMDKAAQQAAKHKGTAGVVGSELRYDINDSGKAINIGPARTMKITTVPGEQAVAEEIERAVAKYKPPKELVVGLFEGL